MTCSYCQQHTMLTLTILKHFQIYGTNKHKTNVRVYWRVNRRLETQNTGNYRLIYVDSILHKNAIVKWSKFSILSTVLRQFGIKSWISLFLLLSASEHFYHGIPLWLLEHHFLRFPLLFNLTCTHTVTVSYTCKCLYPYSAHLLFLNLW